MDEEWTIKLIQSVKDKPAIYNKSLKEHSDRSFMTRLWTEVCGDLVPCWKELTPAEKTTNGKEIQQRWQNLKTCFMRELNKQKKGLSGQAASKRRKYMYFDQLLFLLPTLQDRDTVSDCSPPQAEAIMSVTDEEEATPPFISKQENKTPTYEESLLSILREKRNEDAIDEDKSFLLSLVPAFKQMNTMQKLEVKMQFLNTMKHVFTQSQFYSTQPTGLSSTLPSTITQFTNPTTSQIQPLSTFHVQNTFPPASCATSFIQNTVPSFVSTPSPYVRTTASVPPLPSSTPTSSWASSPESEVLNL